MRLLLINGPNLNMLGRRRPEVYGSATLGELEASCVAWASERDATLEARQSNHEGDLIDWLHEAAEAFDGVILNPGALTHTSYSLRDAIESIEPIPVVEVHLSDIANREEWRRVSVIESVCVASISGRGADGYRDAIAALVGL